MQAEILIPGYGRPYVEGDALDHGGPLVQTIAGVLSPAECAALIDRIEQLGPATAPITTARGPVMRTEIRNNERVMFDDPELARELFARIEGAIAPRLRGMRAVGANERFRCYRYRPGQRFAPHYDGAFIRNDRERSLLTFMVYLNEGFTGGATTFHDWGVDVAPRTGTALLFQHWLLHEGCELIEGTKYVLRSDVMYQA
jgi:predicted 2-oxoglutarate/Fe(II)-dependent dioxygenase YbiX